MSYGRADGAIQQRRVVVLKKLGAIGIRIAAAIARAGFINTATVAIAKKRTRAFFYHMIAIFVYAQVSVDHFRFFEAKVFCDSADIAFLETRGDGFAATGTFQAIDF